MCKYQSKLKTVRFLYNSLHFFLRLNRTLCGIKHGSTPYLENKKIIVQRRRGFSLLLFPLPFARNKENENIESRILIGCALYTKNRFKLCRLQGKDAVDKAVFWSTVWDEVTRIKNCLVENIHSLPNRSYPIWHYQCGILTMDPKNFQTLFSSDFYFSNL